MPPRIKALGPRQRHFIQEWREFRGLTQDELADRIGTTAKNISQIENMETGYTQASLEAIAAVLAVHPSVLLARPPNDADRLPDVPPLPERRERVARRAR